MNYDIKSRFSPINDYKSLDFDTRPQDHVTLLVYRTSYILIFQILKCHPMKMEITCITLEYKIIITRQLWLWITYSTLSNSKNNHPIKMDIRNLITLEYKIICVYESNEGNDEK